MLILYKPLPSPLNVEPDANVTSLPVTNILPVTWNEPVVVIFVFICNPKFGEIIAFTEPD